MSAANCATSAASPTRWPPPDSTPNPRFSSIVSEKRKGSCGTKPMARRRSSSGRRRVSMPSIRPTPAGGSGRGAGGGGGGGRPPPPPKTGRGLGGDELPAQPGEVADLVGFLGER